MVLYDTVQDEQVVFRLSIIRLLEKLQNGIVFLRPTSYQYSVRNITSHYFLLDDFRAISLKRKPEPGNVIFSGGTVLSGQYTAVRRLLENPSNTCLIHQKQVFHCFACKPVSLFR
ncbi:hypothetical protein AVEN_1715-1 [Araneus ventricosus]|uniref:Uncharacterized protein n=1 Tax=Araneus ventricosus TaxID=182803 RepID=A0A4Y2TKM8_ARAVE|nr:hypothetical protein AVEN_84717-1 [Araneus ventricosus]GBO01159.1 hypothetical protein AVEN_1715-1 [Araneus ventricosus]